MVATELWAVFFIDLFLWVASGLNWAARGSSSPNGTLQDEAATYFFRSGKRPKDDFVSQRTNEELSITRRSEQLLYSICCRTLRESVICTLDDTRGSLPSFNGDCCRSSCEGWQPG